ncbi:MAG: autotransporter assembly complex family protein [Amphiplicatus sp.]
MSSSTSRRISAGLLTSVSLAVAAAALAPPRAARAAEDYSVDIVGAPNGLKKELERVSLVAARNRVFATTAALRRAAAHDIEALEKALKAAGYYAGEAAYSIDAPGASEKPKVTFEIKPGALFKINRYEIVYQDKDGGARPASLEEAKLNTAGAADGAALQALQQEFLGVLWNKGYPGAKIVSRRAEADLASGEARAVFVFESGPHAKFGALKIDGAKTTAPVYLEKLKTWEKGEEFDRSKLVSYRDRLAATGLFGGVDVAPGPPDEDGAAPVLLTLEERKRRTIGVGASYSTSEGPGGRIFFEYRNAFHRGELAHVELAGTGIKQSATFNFNKPLPKFPGSGYASFEFSNETTDAYNARTVAVASGLSRRWLDDRLETRAGAAFETSKVKTDMSEERAYLFSTPLAATWNTEDSLLNPTKGLRATIMLTPYTGSDSFTLAEATARTRVNFGADDQFTAAFRARFGAAFATTLAGLASNKRFYAGGGASVRGYAYQAAGPLDADGDPIGGRSVVEGAFEARARVTENIQLAAFLDAGSVSERSLPDFGEKFFLGAGAGLRYFTAAGPIRLDIAAPIGKRESDRGFQLYISLGQPF